jgi:hypothetical protein
MTGVIRQRPRLNLFVLAGLLLLCPLHGGTGAGRRM